MHQDVEYRPSQPEKPCFKKSTKWWRTTDGACRVLSMRWVPEIESQGPSGEGCSNRLVIVGSWSSGRSFRVGKNKKDTLPILS